MNDFRRSGRISLAWSQTYPTRPVHWIVSFSECGPNDIVAWLNGQTCQKNWVNNSSVNGATPLVQREAPASAIISAMTIGITGPGRLAPWRGAVMVLIIAAIVLSICLILLGLTGDFVVDWLWFSTIGYLGVFWTIITAEAEVFSAVFVASSYG